MTRRPAQRFHPSITFRRNVIGCVGAVVEPASKLGVVASYVTLIGLVATAAVTVAAAPWKKPD